MRGSAWWERRAHLSTDETRCHTRKVASAALPRRASRPTLVPRLTERAQARLGRAAHSRRASQEHSRLRRQ
eukprot:scaffold50013_cov53-Phaeocystis_antarctica.AAC.1